MYIVYLAEKIKKHGKENQIKWPTFLSSACASFIRRLLVNDPKARMGWPEILDHEFLEKKVLILSDDAVSDSPFTRPRSPVVGSSENDKMQHSASIARISQLKRAQAGGEDLMSSRDSIKVNFVPQSDIEETDNEEILMMKHESELETSGDGDVADRMEFADELEKERKCSSVTVIPKEFAIPPHFQIEPIRAHNIANFQPVAENPNMVMHRFMDNVDPELKNFMLNPNMIMPAVFPPMFAPIQPAPVQKITEDLEKFSLRMEQSMEAPNAKSSLKKSQKTQHSDGVSTDVSSVPAQTEEWLQLLLKTMQEILDGDLEIYKQENMLSLIVGLLRNPKFSSKLIDLVVQFICLPYAIDMPQSILEGIDKLYLQMKLVPNLVYASQLLCGRKFPQNSMDAMTIPKVDSLIEFTASELKTLSGIYDLVVFLIHSAENFLYMLCDAISVLELDNLFRSFIVSGYGSESGDAVRLTGSIISLISAILQELPENAKLIQNIIFHADIDLRKLLRHKSALIRTRTCQMLRLLGRFCCFSLKNHWNYELSRCLFERQIDEDVKVRKEAMSVIEEFKDFGWFRL